MLGRLSSAIRSRAERAALRAGLVDQADDLTFFIDVFSIFGGGARIAGWAFAPSAGVAGIAVRMPGGREYPLASYGRPSPDVAAHLGPHAGNARFDDLLMIGEPAADLLEAEIVFRFRRRREPRVEHLHSHVDREIKKDPARALQGEFVARLRELPPGRMLEIGSRARSGVVRRDLVPDGWTYTGLDAMAGPNVDIVGDAHRLSRLLPDERFDAVMAFSVLEHLMMPWKVVIEMNRVMNHGAIGLFATHQCWPMHDEPWDFWRFSDTAWPALLNRATGFEIIESRMGQPAFVIAARCHPITNFADVPSGYLSSAVLFRKVADTTLSWPVDVEDVTDTNYPTTQAAIPA